MPREYTSLSMKGVYPLHKREREKQIAYKPSRTDLQSAFDE